MTDKVQKIREEAERLQKRAEHNLDISLTENERQFWLGESNVLTLIGKYIDSMQEEPTPSIWHDASEKAEKDKLYLYLTNQNIVDINRSEGKEFPDYCDKWAYIDDLIKL